MENMGIMDYMVNGIKMKWNIALPATLQAINSSYCGLYRSCEINVLLPGQNTKNKVRSHWYKAIQCITSIVQKLATPLY
jgi:hypothetical protein